MRNTKSNPGGRATTTALAVLGREGARIPMRLAVALAGLPRGAVAARVSEFRGERTVLLKVLLPEGTLRRRRRGFLRKDVVGEPSIYSVIMREVDAFAADRGLGVRLQRARSRPTRERDVPKSDWRYREGAFEQPTETAMLVFGPVERWRGQDARSNPYMPPAPRGPRSGEAARVQLDPVSQLSVYRSGADDKYPTVSARLRMQGVELLRPKWREQETHHLWLDAELRRVLHYKGDLEIIGFELKRDDAERHPVLSASSQMRVHADGSTSWIHSYRAETIKRGERGWRRPPKNAGRAPNRVPWVYAEYGALYDWLDEALRTLAPPQGEKAETLVYDIPTANLPAIVRVPARLTGEKRARLA